MTSAQGLPFFQRHKKKIVFLFLLIVVTCAFLLYQPVKGAFQGWRAESLAEEAQGFADQGDWLEVQRTAIASLQNKESVEALRLLGRSSIETESPRALEFLYVLFAHPEAEIEDRVMVLDHALFSGDLKNASELVRNFSEEDREIPEVRYQIVRLLLMSRRFEEAIQFADAVPKESRDPALDMLLAQGVAGSGIKGAREFTTIRLAKLMEEGDRDQGLEVLNFLRYLQDGWIYGPTAEAAINRFKDDPDLSVQDILNLDFLRIGLKKLSQEEAVEAAVGKYGESDLSELIVWLRRLDEPKRIVALTKSESAQLIPGLFSERIGALEKLGLWKQLSEELEEPPVFVPEPLLFSVQATVAFRAGDEVKYFRLWQNAMRAATQDQRKNWFYRLAASAAGISDTDRRMEAMVKAILHPTGKPPSASELSSLFQWLIDQGETEELLEVSHALLVREPENPLLINNNSYLKALHGKVDAGDVSAMRSLVEALPEQKEIRESYALVLLKSGDVQAAFAELKVISLDPVELSTSGQAIYAQALYQLGREEEAMLLGEKIDWESLTEAEQKALELPTE